MQFWYSTPTTPIDVIGALAVNFGGSTMAANNPNLRWIPFGQSDNLFLDGRVLGGLAGVAAGMFGTGMVRRVGVDVAQGLLGSVVATESVRRASIAKLQQAQAAAPGATAAWGTPAPAVAPAAAAPQIAPQVPAGAPLAAAINQAAQAARVSGYPGSFA